MAKKKQEDAPKGSPAWMATFSDLMNLLLCFFVLLFSMSTVDAEKFEMVVASLQSSFSVLPSGGSSIGEGELISSGISQLKDFSMFFEQFTSEGEQNEQEEKEKEKDLKETYEEEALKESEEMAEEISRQMEGYGIQNQVEVEFNAQYVLLTLNGALLFDSGKSEIREDAYPLVDKIGAILTSYGSNIIEIEGHTDNVPISNDKYENNDVLSMYRALSVANYIRSITNLEASLLKSSGRGEYVPVADNATPEGRARNRRVEVKIYNSYSTNY
ncbi:MAG: flagellar motor protein MotB [Eubacterium sp.]|nr:flagellar motor protein MotB [Eubacterium sp.]